MEVLLAPDARSAGLPETVNRLRRSCNQVEMVEPSLHDMFIEKVSEAQ